MKLAQSPQSFDELRTLIQVENRSIKEHIDNEFRQHRQSLAHQDHCQRFLESLWYPEIYSRQERVAEAHQKTFQWIYEPYAPHRWSSIVHWLEKGEGIYWVSGKAGSGKSTLMNFVHRDERTAALLRVWLGGKEVLTPGFFFWNAGTTLEKSLEGLLRSLLHQILQKVPSLTPMSSESQSTPAPERDGVQNCEPFAAWTERRLRKTFQSVMGQVQETCRICIFIDGLDEISGDSEAVLTAVERLQSADVKVCLSSRPDRSYVEAFRSCAMLRLQDLTEPDIRSYVSDKLQPFMPTEFAVEISYIMNSIVLKAQGVFLWVELVVKALLQGLKNKDTLKQLKTRVESLPSDIEALYSKMLSNINVAYCKHAARLFQMALAGLTGSLLDVALALYAVFDRRVEMTIYDLIHYSRLTEERIPTICAGFLEVHLEDKDSKGRSGKFRSDHYYLSLPIGYNCSLESADVSFYERYARVDFIHRTAVDFLRENRQGQRFLEANSRPCPSPYSTYVRALLAKVTLLGFPEKPANMDLVTEEYASFLSGFYVECDDFVDKTARAFVYEIMRNVALDESETGTAQVSLCDDVDCTLAILHQQHWAVTSILHWSTRWGKILSNWQKRQRVRVPPWPETSPRSSSSDSFSSARSESELFLNRPVDFLGHAASWNLPCYVLAMIDLEQKQLDKDYASYLLCCFMWPLYLSKSWKQLPKSLDLVAELLSRGGNPNIYIDDFSKIIWGLFLAQACQALPPARTAFAMTTKTFIENGADVHIRLLHQICTRDPSFGSDSGTKIYFRHAESVLYVLRSWLQHELALKAIEEIVIDKGGCDSQRFTHFALEKDNYQPRKISERKNDKFISALSAAQHNCWKPREVYSSKSAHDRWARQLGKIFKEISEMDEDSDSRESADEGIASDTDAEEEFHDSMTAQNMTYVQDIQPIHERKTGREMACGSGLAQDPRKRC